MKKIIPYLTALALAGLAGGCGDSSDGTKHENDGGSDAGASQGGTDARVALPSDSRSTFDASVRDGSAFTPDAPLTTTRPDAPSAMDGRPETGVEGGRTDTMPDTSFANAPKGTYVPREVYVIGLRKDQNGKVVLSGFLALPDKPALIGCQSRGYIRTSSGWVNTPFEEVVRFATSNDLQMMGVRPGSGPEFNPKIYRLRESIPETEYQSLMSGDPASPCIY
jgi:hypothetical protein